MAENDATKGAKVGKPKHGQKVDAISGEPAQTPAADETHPNPEGDPGPVDPPVDDDFGPPPAPDATQTAAAQPPDGGDHHGGDVGNTGSDVLRAGAGETPDAGKQKNHPPRDLTTPEGATVGLAGHPHNELTAANEKKAAQDKIAGEVAQARAAQAAEDAKKAPAVDAPPPEPLKGPKRYRVLAGGRAMYRGQQVKFATGEEFTNETWEPHAVAGFRDCGVTIEELPPEPPPAPPAPPVDERGADERAADEKAAKEAKAGDEHHDEKHGKHGKHGKKH